MNGVYLWMGVVGVLTTSGFFIGALASIAYAQEKRQARWLWFVPLGILLSLASAYMAGVGWESAPTPPAYQTTNEEVK